MRNKVLISRRTCLRGMGVALALPLMETMGWADQAPGAAYKPPVRLGFMYMPHGVIMERFWPTRSGDLSYRAAADPGAAAGRARSVPGDEGDHGRADLSDEWCAACAGAFDVADRHAAGYGESRYRQHRDLGGSDHGQLCGRFDAAAVAGIGDDAADAQGKSGRAERGVLLALQLSRADAADAGGDQSAQRIETAVSEPRSRQGRRPAPPPPMRSIARCSIWCSAAPAICAGS